MNIILLAISAALVNNVILSQFMGICPFLGVSKKVSTAAGMGGAVIFVMTIASAVTSVIYHFVLVPLKLSYLNTIVFILVIAALVQFVEMFLKKTIPSLYEALGVYLPLITTNCAVLGIALKNVQDDLNIGESIINGMFSAVGFAIAIIVMAGIREKIDKNDIPESFKGAPIVLITAGLSLGFFIASGLVALVIGLGIVTRYAGITKTAGSLRFYECCCMAGALFGDLFSLGTFSFSLPSWTAGVFWLFAGIYLGSWIIALGEVVNLFSILCRRIGLTRGLPFVILCMAAGKIAGSLYYFASGFQ